MKEKIVPNLCLHLQLQQLKHSMYIFSQAGKGKFAGGIYEQKLCFNLYQWTEKVYRM